LKLLGETGEENVPLKVSVVAKTVYDRKFALPKGTGPVLETEMKTRTDPMPERGIPLFSNKFIINNSLLGFGR
jgi:hypothetical protein